MNSANQTIPGPEPSAGRAVAPVVLQVLPELVTGGVERGTVDIAAAIAAKGWVSLVASAGGPMVADLERVGAEHITLPLQSKKPWTIHRNAGALTEIAFDRKVDIVHARSRAPAWSALIAARRIGAHFVTTYHGAYNAANPVKNLYNSVMARGEKVIAISDFIATQIQQRHRIETRADRHDPTVGSTWNCSIRKKTSAERIIQLANAWRLPGRDAGHHAAGAPDALERASRCLIDALGHLGRDDVRCLLGWVGSGAQGVPAGSRQAGAGPRPRALSCTLSTTAATCRRPTCWPMWWCRPPPTPRPSAASRSRRRRWAGRSWPATTAARGRRSCRGKPAGW